MSEPIRDPGGAERRHLGRVAGLKNRRVLEIGCGDGRLLRQLLDIAGSVIGVEPDSGRLAQARAVAGSRVAGPILMAQARAEQLPFGDHAFPAIIFGWSF